MAKVLEFPALARRWVESVNETAEDAQELLAESIDVLSSVSEAAEAQAALAGAHDALRLAREKVAQLLKRPRLDLDQHTKRYLTPPPEVARG